MNFVSLVANSIYAVSSLKGVKRLCQKYGKVINLRLSKLIAI